MHGTPKAPTETFVQLMSKVRRGRETKKHYDQLYLRILNVVEERIGQEALLNKLVIASTLGVDATQVGYIIDDHPELGRIICKYQRKHGWRHDCRIQMAGEIAMRHSGLT